MTDNLSVLIIGYRRSVNLDLLIRSCIDNNINKIFIALDNIIDKSNDLQAIQDHLECAKVVKNAMQKSPGLIEFAIQEKNAGCAVGVLSACDWFFSKVKYGIVLEDDCIPTSDFFKFVVDQFNNLEINPDAWLICGTQLVSYDQNLQGAYLSKYALTWGWATTNVKWIEIYRSITNLKRSFRSFSQAMNPENSYWNFGALRAELGYVDVWDTVLLNRMINQGKCAILPYQNLIENIGSDEVATHTKGDSLSKQLKKGRYIPDGKIQSDFLMDDLIKKNVYRISYSHLLRNRIRRLLDILKSVFQHPAPLHKKIIEAKLVFPNSSS
jgi:hypothetical protein